MRPRVILRLKASKLISVLFKHRYHGDFLPQNCLEPLPWSSENANWWTRLETSLSLCCHCKKKAVVWMVNPRKIAPDIWRLPFLDQTPTTTKICQGWSRLLTTQLTVCHRKYKCELRQKSLKRNLQRNWDQLIRKLSWLAGKKILQIWICLTVKMLKQLRVVDVHCNFWMKLELSNCKVFHLLSGLAWLVWLVWVVCKKRLQLPESCGHTSIQPDCIM